MATVKLGKTTGRLYEGEQTVEVPNPSEPEPQRGNDTGISLRSLYRQWNAAYRGFVPHGVRLPSPTEGVVTEFDDNPETFVEDEPIDEPEVNIREVEEYSQDYWNPVTLNVTVVPTLIAGIDPDRTLIRIVNQGPGMVWIGHNESVLTGGFPLPPMTTTFYDLELHTTREIWAVQQSGQAGPAQLSYIREYTKEFGK